MFVRTSKSSRLGAFTNQNSVTSLFGGTRLFGVDGLA